MMKSKHVLEKAAQILAEPERWTQSAMARNADGDGVEPEDEDAVCFCAFGAIRRAYHEMGVPVEPSCLRSAEHQALGESAHGGFGFIHFNDRSTHEEVLEMFEDAIDWVEERGL